MAALTRVLAIQSSPRPAGSSVSRRLVELVIDRLAADDASLVVMGRDLAVQSPPHVSAAFLTAIRKPQDERTQEEHMLVGYSDELIDEVRSADLLVIAAPMYNFGIPSTLKAWIDWISVPGVTFRYRQDGSREGLLIGRPAILVTSRGGDYGPTANHPGNFAEPQVRAALELLGFERFALIAANGQALHPDDRRLGLAAAERDIARLTAATLLNLTPEAA